MSETFKCLFGGWYEDEARRWRNPDGSEGGIVATTAWAHESVTVPAFAEVWPGASIGYGASIGNGVEYNGGDWLFVAGPQGSRNTLATAVWSPAHGLRWWVRCQYGITTQQLRERVERDPAASARADDYRHLIAMVESHPGLARAIAEHTATGGTHA